MNDTSLVNRRRALLVGLLTSLIILVVVSRHIDWASFWSTLRRTRVTWVVLACVAISVSAYVRCWRWRVVAGLNDVAMATFWRATVVGYVGNAIYPARLGDVMRVVALQRTSGKSTGLVLGSAVADRLWDMLIFGAVGTIVILITGNVASFGQAIAVVLLGTCGIAIAVYALAKRRDRVSVVVESLVRLLPTKLANRLLNWTNEALRYFANVHRWRTTIVVILLSGLAAAIDYGSIYLCLVSIDLPVPFIAAILTGVLISLVGLLPAAPGYIGIYQVGSVLGLGYFGVEESDALAASIVIHAATLIVVAVLGAWCVVRYGRQMLDAAS
jgi:uncharacterized protein (TIRG00374 family)